LSVLSLCWAAASSAQESTRVPIVFHVAPSGQHHAPPEAFIASQLARANEAFAPTGVSFEDAGRETLSDAEALLVTRADRDRLLIHVKPGAVHCMVVAQLMDVDEPGRERRGVHWYRAGTSRPHMVIISTLAGDYVLAHELGHYFGNPEHSQEAGNLMSYVPGVRPPFLTDRQKQRIQRSLAAMQRRAELPKRARSAR
jgi:hypothetical protein